MTDKRRQPIISVLGHVDAGKCVGPDTRIQLADGSVETAEDLFEDWRERGTKKDTQTGEVYELSQGPEIFGVDGNKVKKCEITHLWKLYKDQLLNFSLKDGSSIKITPEHPFLTVENGKLKFKEAGKLERGDFVAIPEKIPAEKLSMDDLKSEVLKELGCDKCMLAFVTPDFAEKLYGIGKEMEDELLTDFIDTCKMDNRFRIKDIVKICENSGISLKEAYEEIEAVKQATLKQRAGKTSKKISLPRSIEEFRELAYACGLLLGDGDSTARKLSNNSKEIKEEFCEALETSLRVPTKVIPEEERVDRVEILCGKTFWRVLNCLFDYPKNEKSRDISLSSFSLKLPRSILAELISGYMDADGYVSKNGKVKVMSASREMITTLKTALKEFAVHGKIKERDEFYELIISGRHNLYNFRQISFRNDDKREKFKSSLQTASTNSLTDIVP
ncbi:MAG: LAGLIDADG family homing endonuclease, partial [Candidatus Aenigmatarchaeota archaeon]